MFEKDEWTQQELVEYKNELEHEGVEVVLVDTILKPIDGIKTVVYNPYQLKEYREGTVFVFYCDTGKSTLERLEFYRSKLPGFRCVSLRGGRGYWKSSLNSHF